MSRAFQIDPNPDLGLGWAGVYRWCRQISVIGNGSVGEYSVLSHFDIIIIQVDADVAHSRYRDGNIADAVHDDLPCNKPCPPPGTTVDALRKVILKWLGETNCPSNLVLCIPSKSIEAWVLSAVHPDHRIVSRENWECNCNPSAQLKTLPINVRFQKTVSDYTARKELIADSWKQVIARLTQAKRFDEELSDLIGKLD